MQINIDGLYLVLITIFTIPLLIAINPFVKKVTTSYYFNAILGACLLIYVIIFRYYDDWKVFVNGDRTSTAVSKAFLLDLCPFICFVILALMFLDPTRKILVIVAPFAIFGGLITILGEILFVSDNDSTNAIFNWKYIFIGNEWNEMYFMIHYLQVAIGTFVLLNAKIKLKWSIIFGYILFACYLFYIGMIILRFNVTSNATGLVRFDWEMGEYSQVSKIISFLSFPYIAIIGYLMCSVVVVIIVILFWLLQKNKYYKIVKNINYLVK